MWIYTEEEWLDKFYPKEWGDWREEFNIGMLRKHRDLTGCNWMDYRLSGWLSGEDGDGKMKVNHRQYPSTLDHFFIECGDADDEQNVCHFLIPTLQKSVGKYFASVEVLKVESNLDLYQIYISGCDDSSFTKDFIGEDDLKEEVELIKRIGVSDIQSRDYYFTN